MLTNKLNINFLALLLTVSTSIAVTPLHSQEKKGALNEFLEIFPEHFLPFSISENELLDISTAEMKKISPDFQQHFLNLNTSATVGNFALASIRIDNGKRMLFHLEESQFPLSRKVYITVLSKSGYPESSELFAAYEDGINESFTYAIVNSNKLIHRTIKSFDSSRGKLNIKTEKFRLNTLGEIVAL